jgi:hypothetical protein
MNQSEILPGQTWYLERLPEIPVIIVSVSADFITWRIEDVGTHEQVTEKRKFLKSMRRKMPKPNSSNFQWRML